MTTCPECGAYIPDGGKMCISCGWKPEKNDDGILDDIFSNKNPYINYLQQVMDTVVKDFPKDEKIEHDNTGWVAAASYLGPAFIYTYIKNRDSKLICYHANQACLLFMLNIAHDFAGKLPLIGGLIKKAGNVALFALAFLGARNAVAKKMEPVPGLNNLNITILK